MYAMSGRLHMTSWLYNTDTEQMTTQRIHDQAPDPYRVLDHDCRDKQISKHNSYNERVICYFDTIGVELKISKYWVLYNRERLFIKCLSRECE